jgi:ATP-dependent Clp protease ATP-binding subunit ClpA
LDYGGRMVIIIDELDKITVGKSGDKQTAMVSFIQTMMNILENDTVLLKNSGDEIDVSRFIFVINTNLFVDEKKEDIRTIGFSMGAEPNNSNTNSEIAEDVKVNYAEISEKLKKFFPLSVYNRLSSNLMLFSDMSEKVVDGIMKKEYANLTNAIKNYLGEDIKLPNLSFFKKRVLENYDKDLGMR